MLVNNDLSKQCTDLLTLIDNKIYQLAKRESNNITLGTNNNIDYSLVEDLYDYRDILIAKRNCSNCLTQYTMETITSIIRKLTNTIC